MAAISALPSPLPCCRICRQNPNPSSLRPSFSSSYSWSFPSLRLKRLNSPLRDLRRTTVRAVAGEETLVSGETKEEEEVKESPTPEQSVSVPVSASDLLTMFFKAEGTMDESAVSSVLKALEGIEGVSDLKVRICEGIASVELTKQTTVQATGVASNLVEVIQGSGFKLQTLNLSFEDEEDAVN